MTEIKWIKLYVNTFSANKKIKILENFEKGDEIILIFLKILCLAGSTNDSGKVYVTPNMPFTDDTLSTVLGKPAKTVRRALETLVQYEMITIDDKGFIEIDNWDEYQSEDRLEEIRKRDRERRRSERSSKKQRQEIEEKSSNRPSKSPWTVHGQSMENPWIEEEEEEEKDIHSFVHSTCARADESEFSTGRFSLDEIKRSLMGGKLGCNVVMLSDAEIEMLLEVLSLDEFNYYVGVVRDCELKGQHFKRKTHYQAILEMAKKDRNLK